jgi:hypothetical protein
LAATKPFPPITWRGIIVTAAAPAAAFPMKFLRFILFILKDLIDLKIYNQFIHPENLEL